jgi:hypothetical protein
MPGHFWRIPLTCMAFSRVWGGHRVQCFLAGLTNDQISQHGWNRVLKSAQVNSMPRGHGHCVQGVHWPACPGIINQDISLSRGRGHDVQGIYWPACPWSSLPKSYLLSMWMGSWCTRRTLTCLGQVYSSHIFCQCGWGHGVQGVHWPAWSSVLKSYLLSMRMGSWCTMRTILTCLASIFLLTKMQMALKPYWKQQVTDWMDKRVSITLPIRNFENLLLKTSD